MSMTATHVLHKRRGVEVNIERIETPYRFACRCGSVDGRGCAAATVSIARVRAIVCTFETALIVISVATAFGIRMSSWSCPSVEQYAAQCYGKEGDAGGSEPQGHGEKRLKGCSCAATLLK